MSTIQKLEDPAIAENQKIANECGSHLVDCNWDPLLMKVAKNKPYKILKYSAYFCSYKGSGNATMYFTGNSFARKQLSAIKKALHPYYEKMYFVTRSVCLPFNEFNEEQAKQWRCDELMSKTEAFLKKIKPDIIIVSAK